MSDTKKYKRTALVLSVVVGLVLLWFTYQQVRGIHITLTFGNNTFGGADASIYSFFAISFATLPIMLASLVISLSLLNSIRKEITPFTKRNVTKLKVVALLLVTFEACVFVSQRIIYTHFFRFENPDHLFIMEASLSGVVMVLGFVVYCIALVFEYGISLQNQVDETL